MGTGKLLHLGSRGWESIRPEVVYLDDPDLETILFDQPEIAAVKRRGHFPVHIGNWYKRTAMFMPKWACRTWLEVTEVHVEQLGNITMQMRRLKA
jgi:hypothetical protein